MIPVSITIEKFGPVVDELTFPFPERPGLYFMQGRNEAEPRLGSNGAGKSTIWNALTWCLFGKTPDGLKAGDVANWSTPKGARVRFLYRDEHGVLAEVMRQHSPNRWQFSADGEDWEDLADDPTNPVLEDLRLSFTPFLNCVLMAQDEDMFLDLKPEPKATLFGSVMGLDSWLDWSRRAGDRANEADRELRRLEAEVAEQRGKLSMVTENYDDLAEEWDGKRRERLAEIGAEYERLRYEEDALGHSVSDGQRLVDSLAAAQAAARKAQDAAEHSEACPKCGQPVGRRSEDYPERARSTQEALRAWQEGDRALAERKRALGLLSVRIDRLEDEADRLTKEDNPYERLRKKAARDRQDHEAALRALERQADAAAERGAMLGFWVRGFKDIRLAQIAEGLEQLSIEANDEAAALGLMGWELLFEVDKETKSGSVSRGFNVFVKSPHNDQQVPWAAWSGGEAQRLRMATQMGLANLIRDRTGADIPLEVWDEPTDGLSREGIADLLDALRERAMREQRQIWVIDHRSLDYGNFDGGATIVKGPKGSRIEV